jgi:hypothetical protein
MLTYKQKLDQAMLALQTVIDERLEEDDAVQTAFNKLACALDDVVE